MRKNENNKSFGILFFIVFLIIAIWPVLSSEAVRIWAAVISVVFLILGIINSKILTPLKKGWIKLGEILGRVNTIQNANTQNFVLNFNFNQIYRDIPWLNSDDNILKSLIKSTRRLRFNYSENSGKVLPGYIPSIGFLGTARPSIGFVFGNQSDIRYEAAKNGWLTDFPNFNQPFQQIFNSDFDFSGELELFNSIRIDFSS